VPLHRGFLDSAIPSDVNADDLNDSTLFGARYQKAVSWPDTLFGFAGTTYIVTDSTGKPIAMKWRLNESQTSLRNAVDVGEEIAEHYGKPDVFEGDFRIWKSTKEVVIEYCSTKLDKPKYWIARTTREYYEAE
jgi:hypothetical protein